MRGSLGEALHGDEFAVEAAEGEELVVGATFDDGAVVEDEDEVGGADGAQAVGDGDSGSALHEGVESLLDGEFAFGVEGGGGFVEDEDGGVAEECAGDGDALSLAAGEVEAAVADGGVVGLGEGLDEVVGEGGACGGADLVEGESIGTEGDVGGYGVVEEDAVLADEAEL